MNPGSDDLEAIEVLSPGLLTSIQDLGRPGWRRFGVPPGGAMDATALQIANLLVGNEPGVAGLEITLIGPKLRFRAKRCVAICGGDLAPQVDGKRIPAWRPVWIPESSELRFGAALEGCRAYLAIENGFQVPEILGSCSTNLQAAFGGMSGRALAAGDILKIRSATQSSSNENSSWCVNPSFVGYSESPVVRVCAGRQHNLFSTETLDTFYSSEFEVTSQSDRIGYRFTGPRLPCTSTNELLSEAATMGAVQVPPDGHPIILMADCPVTGGYPKISQVIGADLPVLAQLRPGTTVRFQKIAVTEARELALKRIADLAKLKCGVKLKREKYKMEVFDD